MFRGSIEEIASDSVSGWVHSEHVDLRGRTLLAFEGARCVGAGPVGIPRQDLKDAGLGDGRFGFRFGIVPGDGGPRALVVKFEGTDAVLLPPACRLSLPDPVLSSAQRDVALAKLNWKSDRGWINADEFIALRDLVLLGHCTLRPLDRAGPVDGVFALAAERPIATISAATVQGVVAAMAEIASRPEATGLAAITATEAFALQIFEGTHLDGALARASLGIPAPIRIEPGEILVIDARCACLEPDETVAGLTIHFATS